MTLKEQLENAARNGQLDTVQRLLLVYKDEVTADLLNNTFIYASFSGCLDVVKYLLTLDNPKVDYRADNDWAFLLAANNGHLEVVKHLLTLKDPKVDYRAEDDWAFRIAASNGHLDVLKLLLTLDNPRVDYAVKDNEAFRWAAHEGHLEVIEYLLTLPGVDPSVNNFEAVARALVGEHLLVVAAINRWVETYGTELQRHALTNLLVNYGQVINYEQSTHAASVHKSVSDSATKLMNRYGDYIKGDRLNTVLEMMTSYVNRLARSAVVSDPISAGQRYLAGEPTNAYPAFTGDVISPQAGSRFLFVDKGSKVSIQQLLALTYLAALDEKAHPPMSDQDVRLSFVRGLYEARRGYNLNEQGLDNGSADNMICPPGAFNKAIEILAAVHPDCEIVLVTKTQASLKLPKVAEEEVFGYLEGQLNEAASTSSLEGFMTLLNQTQSEGMSVIVSKVKEKIGDRLFEEFGSVYSDDRHHENFKALVDNAEYIPVNEAKLNALLELAKTKLEGLASKEKPMNTFRAILPGYSRRTRVTELHSDSSEEMHQQSKGPRTK